MSNSEPEDGQKERIRRIAAELFAENGYHATGVAELSEAVELGRGALYYHIGSKEALLFEISRVPVERLNRLASAVVCSSLSPVDKFHSLAGDLLVNIADHRAEWTVFFREFHALTGERKDKIMAARDRYEECWRAVIAEGVDHGAFRQVDHVLVKGLLGMFNYSYLWFDPAGERSAVEVAARFSDTLLNGIRSNEKGAQSANGKASRQAAMRQPKTARKRSDTRS